MKESHLPAPQPEVPEVRDYENKRQLAARLGVSVRTIDNLMARGLPHIKLTSKLTRFPRGPVDEWLAERQVRRAGKEVKPCRKAPQKPAFFFELHPHPKPHSSDRHPSF